MPSVAGEGSIRRKAWSRTQRGEPSRSVSSRRARGKPPDDFADEETVVEDRPREAVLKRVK
jgi:hypothetical protein